MGLVRVGKPGREAALRLDLGNGFILRGFVDEDRENLANFGNNPVVAAYLHDRFPHPYSLEDAETWIEINREQDPRTVFCIAGEAGCIGSIGLIVGEDVYRKSAEIGYWLAEPFWGKGIATKAVVALSRYAFEQLDLVRVFAGVFSTNPGSSRVLEKAGFRFEGIQHKSVIKNNRLLDQRLYAAINPKYE